MMEWKQKTDYSNCHIRVLCAKFWKIFIYNQLHCERFAGEMGPARKRKKI
jgi:hypothetical protein